MPGMRWRTEVTASRGHEPRPVEKTDFELWPCVLYESEALSLRGKPLEIGSELTEP